MHFEKPLEINGALRKAAAPETIIHLVHGFAAAPQPEFHAWLDPTLAGRWLFATATRPMTEVSIAPCDGGRFRLSDGQAIHTGRFMHISAPQKLEFSLEDKQTRSRVAIELTPKGR